MARGRAPNLALPPTRALTQQRDYRARRAARISYLEKTNRDLSEQVESLKRELADVKEGKGRDREVERLRQVRQSLDHALSALDVILPPSPNTANRSFAGGEDEKPSVTPGSISYTESSSSASRMIDEDGKGKRKRKVYEEERDSDEDDDDVEDDHGIPEVEGKAMKGNKCGGGVETTKDYCPPRRSTQPPTDETKRQRATLTYPVMSTSPMTYPIGGYGMGPASHVLPSPSPYGRPGDEYKYHPQQQLPPILSLPGATLESSLPQHLQAWEKPHFQNLNGSMESSSSRLIERHSYPWGQTGQQIGQQIGQQTGQQTRQQTGQQVEQGPFHYPALPPLGHPAYAPSTAGSIASEGSTVSHMPAPSPEPHVIDVQYRQEPPPKPTMITSDPSCCNGLFDCSSLPQSLKPIMHNVSISSGVAAASAVALSFERSSHQAQRGVGANEQGGGAWVENQYGSEKMVQSHSATPVPTTGEVTTNEEWQEWNRRASGTWSTSTSETNLADRSSIASGFVTPSASTLPVEATSIRGRSDNARPAMQVVDTGHGGSTDEDNCCWGVMDCGPNSSAPL